MAEISIFIGCKLVRIIVKSIGDYHACGRWCCVGFGSDRKTLEGIARINDITLMRAAKVILVLTMVLVLTSGGFFFAKAAATINQEVDLLELKEQTTKLNRVQAPVWLSIQQRAYWVKTLDYLSSRMESDAMWITSLEFKYRSVPNGYSGPGVDSIVLKGLVRENPLDGILVYDYAGRLQSDARNAARRGQIKQFDIVDMNVGEFCHLASGELDRYATNWKMTLPLPAGYPMQ